MAEPLTEEQLEHVRQTASKMTKYLYRVRADLLRRGHDDQHAFLRQVDETWKSTVALSSACVWVMAGAPGLKLPGGSLHDGPIPPTVIGRTPSLSPDDAAIWIGDGI